MIDCLDRYTAPMFSPAPPFDAPAGPFAESGGAGETLEDCLEAAAFANEQASQAFADGDEVGGHFWLTLASDALSASHVRGL
jgi:hypothetical protein